MTIFYNGTEVCKCHKSEKLSQKKIQYCAKREEWKINQVWRDRNFDFIINENNLMLNCDGRSVATIELHRECKINLGIKSLCTALKFNTNQIVVTLRNCSDNYLIQLYTSGGLYQLSVYKENGVMLASRDFRV